MSANSTGSTPEGITVKPLYTRADTQSLPYADTLPDLPPTCADRSHDVRGAAVDHPAVRRLFHRGGLQRLLSQALAAGGQGVSVAFDLATHRGYDSDHPRVTGDVARPAWPSTRSRT